MNGLRDNKHILEIIAKELLENSRITGLVCKTRPFLIQRLGQATLSLSWNKVLHYAFLDLLVLFHPLGS